MTQLVWGQIDKRHYEQGVDRGVLYLPGSPGIVWNGLTSVVESYEDSGIKSYYLDGIKYLDVVNSKVFQATIRAFSAPKEFDICMGYQTPRPGLMLTGQSRAEFGFSYRTRVDGDKNYKIHLVYNATASATARGYNTLSDAPKPSIFEWNIGAIPVDSDTHKPSPHYILDSSRMNPYVLEDIESSLYGSYSKSSKLPDPSEIMSILTNGITEPLTEPI